jgi:hypothetical protein
MGGPDEREIGFSAQVCWMDLVFPFPGRLLCVLHANVFRIRERVVPREISVDINSGEVVTLMAVPQN